MNVSPAEQDDAQVEPVDDLPPDEQLVAAGLPPVGVHKARSRENVRNIVSVSIVLATLGIALAVAVAALLGSSRADEVADLVFTPMIGLAGAIVGFYFGGPDSTA